MRTSFAEGLPFPADFNGYVYDRLMKRIGENYPEEQKDARRQIMVPLKGS